MFASLENAVFQLVMPNKKWFFLLFSIGYVILTLLFSAGTYLTFIDHPLSILFYDLATKAGQASAVFFVLALLAGTVRRFGYTGKFLPILITFRRQFGISCFAFAWYHAWFVRIIPWMQSLQAGYGLPPFAPFELLGILSLFLLFPLFATSNDFSTHAMGTHWKQLHRLVYVICWTIFLHAVFQSVGFVSMGMGVFAAIEAVSLVKDEIRKRNTPAA